MAKWGDAVWAAGGASALVAVVLGAFELGGMPLMVAVGVAVSAALSVLVFGLAKGKVA